MGTEIKRALSASLLVPLAAGLLVTMTLVTPTGNFPLNDDWVYASTLCELLEGGAWTPHPWASAQAFAHAVWGAMFAVTLGESFVSLRLSTLVLALVAIWATARSARECGAVRSVAVLCGLTLLANPIFLNLAYTYMTDVPFLAMWALAGLFYLRALSSTSWIDAGLGSVFAALAALTRQIGAVVAVAYALAALSIWIRTGRRPDWRRVTAFAVPWGAAGGIFLWIGVGRVAGWDPAIERPGLLEAFALVPGNLGVALLYLGLFALPFAVGGAVCRGVRSWRDLVLAVGLVGAAASLFEGFGFKPLPILGNILYDFGAGPITLRDVSFGAGGEPFSIGRVWWIVTAVALASAGYCLGELWPRLRSALSPRPESSDELARDVFLLLWVAPVVAAPYQRLVPVLFDRYLLLALPPALVLAARLLRDRRGAKLAAWGTCAVLYLVSIACLQDYMMWNRARWDGIDHLIKDYGVSHERIDGGFEFNGLYTGDEYRRRSASDSFWDQGQYGFWVLDPSYAISMTRRSGYEPLRRIVYVSWLGMSERGVWVLRRQGIDEAAAKRALSSESVGPACAARFREERATGQP